MASKAGAARALWLAALLALSGLTGAAQQALVGQTPPAQEQQAAAPAAPAAAEPAVAAPTDPEQSAAQAAPAADAAPAEPDADTDGMPDAWEDFFGLNKTNPMDATGDLDGDGVQNLQEYLTKGHPNGKKHRYFAEGATGFFKTSIGLFNPSETETAAVQVAFVTESGTTYTKQVALQPRHRSTVSANTELGFLISGIAIHVESNISIAADRFMRWGLTNYGSSLDSGVEAPSTSWYFSEGATGPFALYYLLFNPGNAPATVQMKYLREGAGPITKTVTVGPHRRESVFVNTQDLALLLASTGAQITSNVPIVAERAMYLSSLFELFSAGGASSGTAAPSTTWYFAEGATGPFFDEYILLANPSSTTVANAQFTYRREDGTPFVRTYTVPPESRRTVWINEEAATVPALAALATGQVSVKIQSDLPIAAERSMWWSRARGWYEVHATTGLTTPGPAWMIAEAAFDGPTNDQSFVLISNTSNQAGTVRVTVFKDDGTTDSEDYAIGANARRTVEVGPTFGLADSRVSVIVESLGVSPIQTIVEYVRYSSTGSRQWNAGGAAAAIPLSVAPPDTAPTVVSTAPATGATDVARNGNITVTFSEPVNVTPNAFTLECPASTPIPFTNTTASPATTFVLDPTANLPVSTSCVLKIIGSQVTDADPSDPPNEMVGDVTVTFTTGGCAVLPITPDTLAPATTGAAYGPVTFSLGGGEPPINWTVVTGTLPTGLTLSAAGVLSGTPTVSGTSNFEIKATDADTCSSTIALSLSVSCPTITIAPTSFAPATAGVAYGPVQFTQTGGTSVTWSVSAGTLPTGMTLDAAGLLSGTPTVPGSYTFTVLATDPNGCSNSIVVTIVVNCPVITVAPTSLSPASVGVAYGPVQFTQTGAPTAVTWTLASGTLPAGMTLTAAGVLSGTPTAPGTFTFTVTATDANGCAGSVTVTLDVSCPTITVTPTSTPDGNVGVAYGPVQFAQTGAPTAVTWSVSSGTLPTGLTLNPSTGELSGTPTAPGNSTFTVTATDANGCAGSVTVSINITCPTITVSPGTLTGASVGVAYGPVQFTQTGAPTAVTWAVSSGTLPAGITLSPSGVLSGTATAPGTFTFTVTATDANGCTGSVTVTLEVTCPVITVSPTSLTNGTAGVAYGPVNFSQTGAPTAVTWSVSTGTLPAGLTLSAAGVLSGTPTVVGTFPFTALATDANGCTGSQALTLQIDCPTITITPTSMAQGTVGTAYPTVTFNQTGGVGTMTWAVTSGALPTGLTFNPATRQITGTPTVAGTYTFTLTATDQNGCTGTVTITVEVVCPTITFNPSTLPDGQGGIPYTQTFTFTGGTAPFTSSLTGTLPAGMTYTAATHTLSGTPTTVGSFPLTISATDQYGCAATTITPTLLIHPNAINDTYPETIVGNIGVNSAVIAFNVMTNDILGPGFAVTPIVNGLSAAGGTVNIGSNGLFTYNPPVGYNGPDSFTYTVVNGPLNDSATVSFTVAGMLWFVNNNAGACPGAPCDGRRSHPFTTLAAFQTANDGAAGHPNNNQPVFIYESATSYTGPVTLRASQKLIGQDASVSLASLTGLTLGASAGTLPAMNATAGQATVISAGGANAQVVLLNSGNLVRGLSVATGAAGTTGVKGTSGGTFEMNDASIAGSGPAIDLTGYALTVNLISAASGGGTKGIGLTNTTGSFTVAGTGTAGSGGTITGSTDAGVVLSNATNVTLNRMIIQNAANEGVRGSTVNGFAMTGTTVQNNGNDVLESNIEFANLLGTATFNGILSTGSSGRNMDIRQTGTASLTLTVDNSDFTNTSPVTGEQGILLDQIDSAQATVSITNSRFTANRTSHVHMTIGNDANLNFTLTGNTMAGGNAGALAQNVIVHAAASYNGETRYNIANNTINGAVLSALVVNLGGSVAGGVMQGQVLGNLIGTAGVTKSGSQQGHGITIDAQAGGAHTTLVKNNVIRETRDLGMRIGAASGAGVLNATVQGNDIRHVWTPLSGNVGDNSAEAMFITTGSQVTDAHTVCLDIGGAGANANTFQTGPNATIPGHAYRFRQRMLSTVRFPGYAGGATDTTALANFISGRNNLPPPGGAPPGAVTVEPAGGISGGAACAAPTLP